MDDSRGSTLRVSIHAPREGCDTEQTMHSFRHSRFNSRTPGGVRQHSHVLVLTSLRFQFTHPGRGATAPAEVVDAETGVSIHAPREGCDWIVSLVSVLTVLFQFTHPGRGATGRYSKLSDDRVKFQFTHPGRGATACKSTAPSDQAVSIHAPREGCDYKASRETHQLTRFNSRTPGGVRLERSARRSFAPVFQFTHPGRGATWK